MSPVAVRSSVASDASCLSGVLQRKTGAGNYRRLLALHIVSPMTSNQSVFELDPFKHLGKEKTKWQGIVILLFDEDIQICFLKEKVLNI